MQNRGRAALQGRVRDPKMIGALAPVFVVARAGKNDSQGLKPEPPLMLHAALKPPLFHRAAKIQILTKAL